MNGALEKLDTQQLLFFAMLTQSWCKFVEHAHDYRHLRKCRQRKLRQLFPSERQQHDIQGLCLCKEAMNFKLILTNTPTRPLLMINTERKKQPIKSAFKSQKSRASSSGNADFINVTRATGHSDLSNYQVSEHAPQDYHVFTCPNMQRTAALIMQQGRTSFRLVLFESLIAQWKTGQSWRTETHI